MAIYEPTEQDSGAIIGVSLSSGLIDDTTLVPPVLDFAVNF